MSVATEPLPGEETLIASWRALAELSPGARVTRRRTSVAATFPSWEPLNNAIVLAIIELASVGTTATELRSLYADAGIGGWALWVPSPATDFDAPDRVGDVPGFNRDTTTVVMELTGLDGFARHPDAVRTTVDAAGRAGDEPVPEVELPRPEAAPGLAGWALVADGFAVSGGWSFVHGTDCGIYAVGTAPRWRQRGFARALMHHMLADARDRGARTATLQSTRLGRHLYESLGFRTVGRYEEWVPK